MIGGKVIGIVRREGLATLLNVGGAGEEIFAAEGLLGEAEVRCEEDGRIDIGDEVWWDDRRVIWSMRADRMDSLFAAAYGDVEFPRRA